MRTPPGHSGSEAEVVLADALESVGLRLVPPSSQADLALDLGGPAPVELEVRSLSHASPGRVRSLVARHRAAAPETLTILVADSIPVTARQLLDAASWGWLDRRGHLHLRRAPALHVDANVAAATRPESSSKDPIAGKAGVAVALRLLMNPDGGLAVRGTASDAEMSPSAVSRAAARLREHALLDTRDRPLIPELFWALADAWPRDGTLIKRAPSTTDAPPTDLRMNVSDLDEPGWALTGTRAALAWGVPLVATDRVPLELLLPDSAGLRKARQRFGDATTPKSAAALLHVAPVPLAARQRVELAGETFPGAHPAVMALDLATDLSRGVEALERWDPPKPFIRVW